MQLTALVEHILVQKDGHLSEVIAEDLDISLVRPASKNKVRHSGGHNLGQHFSTRVMHRQNQGPLDPSTV